jgi:hypothetical protein
MWHARVNGQWHAAPDEATLRDWARRGWVGPATLVYEDAWPAPRYAGQIEGLCAGQSQPLVPFPPLSPRDGPGGASPRWRLRPPFGPRRGPAG